MSLVDKMRIHQERFNLGMMKILNKMTQLENKQYGLPEAKCLGRDKNNPQGCTLRNKCLRFTRKTNERGDAFMTWQRNHLGECRYFISNEE